MKVLRWIILLPGAIIALMIGSFFGGIVGGTADGMVPLITGQQLFIDVGSALTGSFMFAFAAILIAPTHQKLIGMAAVSAIAVLALGTIALSSLTTIPEFVNLSFREVFIIPALQIIGSIGGARQGTQHVRDMENDITAATFS